MSSSSDHPGDSTSFSSLPDENPRRCHDTTCGLLTELITKLEVDLAETRANCQNLTSSLTWANKKNTGLEKELATLHSEAWQDKQSLSALHWDVVMNQHTRGDDGGARPPARPPNAHSVIDNTPTAVPTTQDDLAAAVQAFARIAAMNKEGPATGYYPASAPADDAAGGGENPLTAAVTAEARIMPALENNTYASDREWINELLRKNITLLGDKMAMQKEIDMLWGKVWKSEGKDKFGRDLGEIEKDKKQKEGEKRQALAGKQAVSAAGSSSCSECIDEEEIANLLGLRTGGKAKTAAAEHGDQDDEKKEEAEKKEEEEEEEEGEGEKREDAKCKKANRLSPAAKPTMPSSAPESAAAAALPTVYGTSITTPAAATTPNQDSADAGNNTPTNGEGEGAKEKEEKKKVKDEKESDDRAAEKRTSDEEAEKKTANDEKDKETGQQQQQQQQQKKNNKSKRKRKNNWFRSRRGGRGRGRGGQGGGGNAGSDSGGRGSSTTFVTTATH